MDLKATVEKTDTKPGLAYDITIQFLVIVSVVTFSIETLPGLQTRTLELLALVEVIIVAIFTLDYVLRIYVADRKFGYIFSFYGMVDLLAIAPFYLSLGIDLRSLRILRMLRLFRIFKLVRYNDAMQRFKTAFYIAKEEVVIFGVVTMMLLYLSSVGIYYFENEAQPENFKSIFHSFWWAITTLTTVGYGDVYPITAGGRIFTFLILMIGLGIVAVPAGLFASALSKARIEDEKNEEL